MHLFIYGFLILLFSVLLYLNCAVTYLVIKDSASRKRKILLLLVVWFVPVFGGLLAGYAKSEELSLDRGSNIPRLIFPLLWLYGNDDPVQASPGEGGMESESDTGPWTDG